MQTQASDGPAGHGRERTLDWSETSPGREEGFAVGLLGPRAEFCDERWA